MKPNHIYEFGNFRLDTTERVLESAGNPVSITPKALDVLIVLVENHGRIIGREELINKVWPDTFVEDNNLAFNISVLRKLFRETGPSPHFIETVPKRGYRFVAEVVRLSAEKLSEEGGTGEDTTEESSALATAGDPPASTHAIRRFAQPQILAFALLAMALAGFLGYKLWTPHGPMGSSIAVLPFRMLSSAKGEDYLGSAMADALITRLCKVSQFTVRPISAVRRYETIEIDPLIAGRDLLVESVLLGTIGGRGDRIQVAVKLIRLKDGKPAWSDQFEAARTDIIGVEDRISLAVAGVLNRSVTASQKNLMNKPSTLNAAAYQLYLQGGYHWNRWSARDNGTAIDYFRRAIELDAGFALAYAGLANAYCQRAYLGADPPKTAMPVGKAAAIDALRMDNQLPEAHVALASVLLFYDWDFPGAKKEIDQALALSPNYAEAHSLKSSYYVATGQFEASVRESKLCAALDPLSVGYRTDVGWRFLMSRQYDGALQEYAKALELDANDSHALQQSGVAYEMKGMPAEAVAAFLRADVARGISQEVLSARKEAFERSGIRGFWEKSLEQALADRRGGGGGSMGLAILCARLGYKDQAFQWLEEAYNRRSSDLIYANINPRFDSIRSDVRFIDLMRRVGTVR